MLHTFFICQFDLNSVSFTLRFNFHRELFSSISATNKPFACEEGRRHLQGVSKFQIGGTNELFRKCIKNNVLYSNILRLEFFTLSEGRVVFIDLNEFTVLLVGMSPVILLLFVSGSICRHLRFRSK